MAGKPEEILTSETIRRLNEYSNRIKNLEQRIERIENRMNSLEETALIRLGELKVSFERVSQKLTSFSERLSTLENEVLKIEKELGKMALKSDLKKIETFIDVVNPVTSKFVTREELERILEDREKEA